MSHNVCLHIIAGEGKLVSQGLIGNGAVRCVVGEMETAHEIGERPSEDKESLDALSHPILIITFIKKEAVQAWIDNLTMIRDLFPEKEGEQKPQT